MTLNAFQDGNRLAYLALTIAIAIDSLVFMSGLFGANAVRSPLSDVPSLKARSASQLEGIIENSLLPDTYETARATLHAMRPIAPFNGFIAEVWIPNDGSGNSHVMGVLNAGATIGAVARDPARSDHYFIRAELFEFLSVVAKKAFEADKDKGRLAELERAVGVALLRDVPSNVQTVQDALHPMNEDRGFSAEVRLKETHPADIQVIRKVLNAGASFGAVQRVGNDPTHFFVHRDLVRTLSNIQARLMVSGAYNRPQIASQREGGERHGGQMNEYRAPVQGRDAQAQLAAPTMPKARVLTDEDIRQQFIDQLIQAIGVKPEVYARATGPAIGAAISAGEAFNHVRERNPILARSLRDRDERAEKAFFDAYSTIQSRIADHDERGIDLLNEAYEELRNKWPVIMLMPEGPYENLFEGLIAQLEPGAGAGRLSVEDRNLLLQLKSLKAQLSASARNSVEDWRRLEGAFQPNAADPTHVVMFEQAAGKTRYQG